LSGGEAKVGDYLKLLVPGLYILNVERGARFFHGTTGPRFSSLRSTPMWMTTRVRTAADFGLDVARVVAMRQLLLVAGREWDMRRFIRDDLGSVGASNTMWIEADGHDAPRTFCAWASRTGFDGWYIEDFYRPEGGADVMICQPNHSMKVASWLRESEVARALG